MKRVLLSIGALAGVIGIYAQPQSAAVEKSAHRVYPPLVNCIAPGATEISGKLSEEAAPEDITVERNYRTVETDGVSIDPATGVFTVKLKERLLAGNGVRFSVGKAHVDKEVGMDCAVAATPAPTASAAGAAPAAQAPDAHVSATDKSSAPPARAAADPVPAPPAAPPGFPTRLNAPKDGDTSVTGQVNDPSATKVDLFINGAATPDATTPTIDSTTGAFTLTLPSGHKFLVNQSVIARPDHGLPSVAVVVTTAAPEIESPKVSTLKEGDKTVSGTAEGKPDNVLITVLDHRKAFLEEKKVQPDQTSGNFVAGLTHVLAEDDYVNVTSLKGDDKKSPATEVRVETAQYNWGRVRAYFSLGATSSKDDDNFQKVRPFISLNLDKNWINSVHCYPYRFSYLTEDELKLPEETQRELLAAKGMERLFGTSKKSLSRTEQARLDDWVKKELETVQSKERSYQNYKEQHEDWRWRCDARPFTDRRWYWLLNTYFEARLQNANSLSISQINKDTIKTGDRVGYYEFGIYAPYNHVRTSWRFDGQRYAMFMAPLFKGGMETIPTPSAGLLDSKSNFKFLAGGFRSGLYRAFPNSHSVAPELVSWVDFTWGRWDRLLRGPATPKSVPMRFESTGRLKIPYSPFTIGFTSNTGPGPDEFTLFAGTRFDLSKILSKIAPNIK